MGKNLFEYLLQGERNCFDQGFKFAQPSVGTAPKEECAFRTLKESSIDLRKDLNTELTHRECSISVSPIENQEIEENSMP